MQVFELVDVGDLLVVILTCKRLRDVGVHHGLWRTWCARIFETFSGTFDGCSNDFNKLNLSTWGVTSYFELYQGLRRWEPYLEWWASADSDILLPLRFCLEAHSGRIAKSCVDIVQDFNDRLPLVPGSQVHRFRGGDRIVVGRTERDCTPINVQDIGYLFTPLLNLDWHASTS